MINLSLEQKQTLLTLSEKRFQSSIEVKQKMVQERHLELLVYMAGQIVECFNRGGKLLLCGNGGSASDAQHLAAELLIRLRSSVNRQALPAIALTLDTSTLTACGNDYGFDGYYARMIEALAKPNDILLAITTSGKSKNILLALEKAKSLKLSTFAFLGSGGGPALPLCDKALVVPSDDTAHIQEAHITSGHLVILLIEEIMMRQGTIKAPHPDPLPKGEREFLL